MPCYRPVGDKMGSGQCLTHEIKDTNAESWLMSVREIQLGYDGLIANITFLIVRPGPGEAFH